MSKIKKTVAILLAVLFLTTVTASAVSTSNIQPVPSALKIVVLQHPSSIHETGMAASTIDHNVAGVTSTAIATAANKDKKAPYA